MLTHTYAVIMAGGKGQRFWPLSTSRHPKQVLSLVSDAPMISLAVDRLAGLIPPDRVMVITGASMVAPIRRALPQLPPANVIGEPMARDTAAAVALGSLLVERRDPQGVVCILTADHVIGNVRRFQSVLRHCARVAMKEDVLITIGIPPQFPSTGFGYIEAGVRRPGGGRTEFYSVRRFVEKPNLATARKFLRAGNYSWNSGMFIWSARTFQRALRAFRPPLADMAVRLMPLVGTKRFPAALTREYQGLERISVDYAIMEKAQNIVMAKGDFPWSDIGSWAAIADHFPTNAAGNCMLGDCLEIDSGRNIVFSRDRLTALIGVRDLIVVQAAGATLVCAKDRAQDVKKMVELLEKQGRYSHML